MKNRLVMLMLLIVVLASALAAARPAPSSRSRPNTARRPVAAAQRPLPQGEYTMRGDVNVLSASPWNPAGKDRLRTRVVASLERDRSGTIFVNLTHAPSGQSCRFEAGNFGRSVLAINPQQSCRFKALASSGSLRLSNGWLEEKQGRLRFEGRMDIQWLSYSGTISVAVEGPRTR